MGHSDAYFIPNLRIQKQVYSQDLCDFVSLLFSALLLEAQLEGLYYLFPSAGLQARMAVPGFLCGCWEFELRFSCLQSKHSYG